MKPAVTHSPRLWMKRTLSSASRRRFWNFLVSFSASASGVSMPMNT